MNRIKLNEYFYLDEFICPEIYLHKPDNGLSLLNPTVINIAYHIRKLRDTAVNINNWFNYFKGLDTNLPLQTRINMLYANNSILKNRGLRDINSTVGAKNSQHKLGNAIDIDINGMAAFAMYMWAKGNSRKLYELGVRRIEHYTLTGATGRGWLHLDTKEHGKKEIQIIDLTKIVDVWKVN